MEKLGRSRDHMKILPGALRRGRRHGRGGARQAGAARQPRPLRQCHRLALDRAGPRCVAASIRTARCPRFRRPTPARAAASGPSSWRRREGPDRAAARPAARRLCRPRLRRHAGDHRRPDGGMAVTEGSDGFNVMFPYLPGRPRRLRRPRGAGIAAARPFPARVRRQDVARESRPAAPAKPVFRHRAAAVGRVSPTASSRPSERRSSAAKREPGTITTGPDRILGIMGPGSASLRSATGMTIAVDDAVGLNPTREIAAPEATCALPGRIGALIGVDDLAGGGEPDPSFFFISVSARSRYLIRKGWPGDHGMERNAHDPRASSCCRRTSVSNWSISDL